LTAPSGLYSIPMASLAPRLSRHYFLRARAGALSLRAAGSAGRERRSYAAASSPAPSSKLGRFDRELDVLRIDQKGDVTEQKTSVKELLLYTEMHVSEDGPDEGGTQVVKDIHTDLIATPSLTPCPHSTHPPPSLTT
jgi:hypothetical protein